MEPVSSAAIVLRAFDQIGGTRKLQDEIKFHTMLCAWTSMAAARLISPSLQDQEALTVDELLAILRMALCSDCMVEHTRRAITDTHAWRAAYMDTNAADFRDAADASERSDLGTREGFQSSCGANFELSDFVRGGACAGAGGAPRGVAFFRQRYINPDAPAASKSFWIPFCNGSKCDIGSLEEEACVPLPPWYQPPAPGTPEAARAAQAASEVGMSVSDSRLSFLDISRADADRLRGRAKVLPGLMVCEPLHGVCQAPFLMAAHHAAAEGYAGDADVQRIMPRTFILDLSGHYIASFAARIRRTPHIDNNSSSGGASSGAASSGGAGGEGAAAVPPAPTACDAAGHAISEGCARTLQLVKAYLHKQLAALPEGRDVLPVTVHLETLPFSNIEELLLESTQAAAAVHAMVYPASLARVGTAFIDGEKGGGLGLQVREGSLHLPSLVPQ